MKRYCLLFFLLLAGISVHAQTKIGIKFGPNLSLNRVENNADTVSHESLGAGLRFMVGPFIDIELSKNYYVHTGIVFSAKRTGIRFTDQQNSVRLSNAPTLNYVSIPATMKLYTNEIDLDKKLYLQFGGSIDVLTGQPEEQYSLFERTWFMDVTLMIAAGLEYDIGIDTRVYAGFLYQRGLINVIRTHAYNDQFKIWNDVVSLELGIKF